MLSVTTPEQREEVFPRFRRASSDNREGIMADLGRDPLLAGITGAGVIDRDPSRGG